MSDGSCPNRERLVDYAAGVLPEGAADAVIAHIENCQACQAVLQTLHENGDTLRPDEVRPPADGLPDMSANQPGPSPGRRMARPVAVSVSIRAPVSSSILCR